VVGDNRETVFPNEFEEARHLMRFTAEVDLAILDASAIEVIT
jgi:hypothetical protein